MHRYTSALDYSFNSIEEGQAELYRTHIRSVYSYHPVQGDCLGRGFVEPSRSDDLQQSQTWSRRVVGRPLTQ